MISVDDLLLQEVAAIPDRMSFKIGDVADLVGVPTYVLRYWESEFEILRPKKAANQQRIYSRKDVENVLLIRKLLHRDKFSVEGARGALSGLRSDLHKEKNWVDAQVKIDALQNQADQLILDIRRLRKTFQTGSFGKG